MEQMDPTAVRSLLKTAAVQLRSLQEENVTLHTELAKLHKHAAAAEIVSLMDSRGLSDKAVPFQKKVASLLASEKDLGSFRRAIELTSADMSLASVSELSDTKTATNALHDFLTDSL